MYTRRSTTLFPAMLLLVAACGSTPTMAPLEAAAAIAEKIAADDLKAANTRFDAIEGSERHREVAFTVLYGQARDRYEQGDYPTAIRFLRFLVKHYEPAGAPKEALLYALFLERSRTGQASKKTAAEMDQLASEVAKRDGGAPVWLDLVRAQTAVDRGRYGPARASLARFRAKWDGNPASLGPYVNEIDRFLSTHREDTQ